MIKKIILHHLFLKVLSYIKDIMSNPEVVEDFIGVYLLYCENPKYEGRTYIGYTRDPNRRIRQHNRGIRAGGAFRTNNIGPWKMVITVYGFPNTRSALKFEWAWQKPKKSIRLKFLRLRQKRGKETEIQFKIRVLSEMLRIGPWNRLPLVIRWLESEFYQDFAPGKEHPSHMIVKHGPVKAKLLKRVDDQSSTEAYVVCLLCFDYLDSTDKLTCLNVNCNLVTHLTCLADLFLTPGEYVPVEGNCPFCSIKLLWGDLIRKMKGCSIGPFDTSPKNCEKDKDEELNSQMNDEDESFVEIDNWYFPDEQLCSHDDTFVEISNCYSPDKELCSADENFVEIDNWHFPDDDL